MPGHIVLDERLKNGCHIDALGRGRSLEGVVEIDFNSSC
jgi:hypothetical protein